MLPKRRMSGREMYENRVAEKDWMVSEMRVGRPNADILPEVTGFIGMGGGPAALPGRGERPPGDR